MTPRPQHQNAAVFRSRIIVLIKRDRGRVERQQSGI